MQLNQSEPVIQIPDSTNQKLVPERVNLGFHFVTKEMAVVSDGAGKLHFINTGNREDRSIKWTVSLSYIQQNKYASLIITSWTEW